MALNWLVRFLYLYRLSHSRTKHCIEVILFVKEPIRKTPETFLETSTLQLCLGVK